MTTILSSNEVKLLLINLDNENRRATLKEQQRQQQLLNAKLAKLPWAAV
jgi:hypothetical protein